MPGSGVICGKNGHYTKKEPSTVKIGVGGVGWGGLVVPESPHIPVRSESARRLSSGSAPCQPATNLSSVCYPQGFSPSVLPCASLPQSPTSPPLLTPPLLLSAVAPEAFAREAGDDQSFWIQVPNK